MLDQDYRPLAIQDNRSDGLNVGFAFDPVGNLTALTAPGNTAPVVSLGYDTLGRLTAFKDGPTGTVIDGYSYDATGNRLSAQVNGSTQAYSYPTDSHRLASVAGAARSYDAAGNTTAIDGTAREFAYDATGRLSQAKRSATLAMEYRYNDRGEQVRRFLGTTNTYTVYDEVGHWLGDYDTDGKAIQQAIWLDNLPVGVLAGTFLNYVQPDHLGAPRTVIDPVRDVAIWKWDIKGEAFGNSPPDQDADRDGTAFVFGMRFPGQRYDSATGLNQNYFRDYDTSTGRYGQSDPIGLAGGTNTFLYVMAKSLELFDPLGLIDLKIPGAAVSIHANPGPDVTDFRPEHEPAHVHLGSNDGPRVDVENFKPLTAADARKMTKEQLKMCARLTTAEKVLIRARQAAIFKYGKYIIKAMAMPAVGADSFTTACRSDPVKCAELIESAGPPPYMEN